MTPGMNGLGGGLDVERAAVIPSGARERATGMARARRKRSLAPLGMTTDYLELTATNK